jgi:hypothetical protein
MRRDARTDANQGEIIDALRGVGASVEPLHFVGRGVPDILVGWRSDNYLMEIKDGNKPPSKRALTPDEERWHQMWAGQVVIVESVDDALKAIGAI